MAETLGFTGPMAVSVAGTVLAGLRTATLNERSTQPRVDVTVATDTSMQYMNDLSETPEATLTVEGLYQTGTTDMVFNVLAVGTPYAVIYMPEGTASNKPKAEGTPTLTDISIGRGFRDAVPYSLTFTQVTSAFVRGTIS